MKKLFLLPALFALVATGCGDSPAEVGWSSEVKAEMTQYLGLVLPYVQFDAATLYHGYDEEEGGYFIGDDSETNVLDGYGDRLIRTGWTAVTQEGYIDYTKSTEAGDLTLHYEWYEETELYPCGNEIAVYIDGQGGGGGDDPVTGTYEFVIEDLGWGPQEKSPSANPEPGLLIETDIGGNQDKAEPAFYTPNLRLYANNTLTLSADNITKIEFDFSKRENQGFTPSIGEITAISNQGATWQGDASSITFTLGNSKQIWINKITVTGTFSGGVEPIDPGDERTTESVAKEIASNLNMSASAIEMDGEDAYISVVFEDVTSLKEACEAGIPYLPDYLEQESAPAADKWQDGDDGYFAEYIDAENAICVEIGSYYSDGEYVTQFCAYYVYE